MTIGFSIFWPDGQTPTLFPGKILHPYVPAIQEAFPDMLPKIHTFREGFRWRAGMKMHMVTGNRTPQRQQFNTDIPELQTCISAQNAIIRNIHGVGLSIEIVDSNFQTIKFLTPEEKLLFAANDGFNSIKQMQQWFFPGKPGESYRIDGQIIHWTSLQY